MLIYLAAGAVSLIYLMAVPVRAGLAWKTGGQLRLGVTVGPLRFTAHGGVKYAVGAGLIASLTHDSSGRSHELNLMNRLADAASLKNDLHTLARPLKYLFRHVRPWRLRARMHLSLPDAALNASLYGVLNTAFSLLRAARPSLPLDAAVSADFRSHRTQLDLCGILSCRLGHIMAAALLWARDYLVGRIHTWTANSRLKAS